MAIITLRRNLLALAAGGSIGGTLSGRADAQAGARIDFEDAAVGSLPPDFTPALTGGGGPVNWSIVEDATAPAGPKVLAQTSSDRTDNRFPLAILRQPFRADIEARVRFKAVAGEVDRAAGLVIRLRDANNYYVVRANALEDNVQLYRVVAGDRTQFAGVSTKVTSGVWHELRLRAQGSGFEVFFNGRSLYTASDTALVEPGRVALWTKADSVSHFDDLTVTGR